MIEAALTGRLARDGELKTSAKGKPYLRLTVAVGESSATTWVGITAFDPTAIDNASAFTKGSAVYVEGKLTLNEWMTQAGEQRHGLSVLSWHCRLSAIGRNKPPKRNDARSDPTHRAPAPASPGSSGQAQAGGGDFYSDEIPF